MNKIELFQMNMPEAMEAAIFTDRVNRFWFTGFNSSAGLLIITRTFAKLIIDFRYIEEAEKKARGCDVLLQEDLFLQISTVLRQAGISRISVDTGYMTLEECYRLHEELPKFKIDLSGTAASIREKLRMMKSGEELNWHREAQRITDETFSHICNYIRPGLTEVEIAMEIGTMLTKLGSDDRTFNFIVASGENSSLPHGFATERKVCAGDLITMDFGAVKMGRLSDMTRTVALGKINDEQQRVYNIVEEAQKRALDIIRPGASCISVDAAARNYIYEKGYNSCFSHGLGHSVGIEVHENPRFNKNDKTVLAEGMIMTVEPGIYLKNRFGVRIEDMIIVTKDGMENLTYSSKSLITL